MDSRMSRLGRKLSHWWRRETTATDVSNAFYAAAKAHEKFSNSADATFKALRDWSNQLASPSFAPELGNPMLQEFMQDICVAIKPDPTKTCQLNELLASVAQSFQMLTIDELNCKKYMRELMVAKKSVDKCKSYSQDSGLLEKTCEHWESRLDESIQVYRTKSVRQLRRDISLLLSYLQSVEPATHESLNQINNVFQSFAKIQNGSISTECPSSQGFQSRQETGSPLFQPYLSNEGEDQTSAYSGDSAVPPPGGVNTWAVMTS